MTKYDLILLNAKKSGIIAPADLLEILNSAPDRIRLIDASYPPNPSLPAIGNAVTFDIDDIADPDSPMAHMLPPAEVFAEKVGALGIANDDFVIAYDQSGFIMAASRAWWMFRTFGHDNVAVLDGGLIGWIQKNHPVTQLNYSPAPARFDARFRPEFVVSFEQMKDLSASRNATILDARPPERFGPAHIPHSANLPALALMTPSREMISSDVVAQYATQLNLKSDSSIIATCGSGVTACAVALALFREGYGDIPVYDGSWTEWSARARSE